MRHASRSLIFPFLPVTGLLRLGWLAAICPCTGFLKARLRWLFVSLVCWSLALVPAYALDISGVALGSDLAGAQAILVKINPALSFEPIRLKDGSRIGLVARELASGVSAYDGKVEEFVRDEYLVLVSHAGTVRYVEHRVKTTRDRIMSYPRVVQELRAKYGGPSSQSSPNGKPEALLNNIVWESDAKNRLYVGPVESGPCGMPSVEHVEYADGVIDLPRVDKSTCGSLVMAKVPRPTGDGVVVANSKPLGRPFEGKIPSYSVFILVGAGLANRF